MAPSARPEPSTTYAEPPASGVGGLLESTPPGDSGPSLVDEIHVSRSAPSSTDVRHAYGRVESAMDAGDPGVLRIRVGDSVLRARRAVSCLVEPAMGDRVLCAVSEESFVLAVLSRDEASTPVTLSAEGDVALRARSGTLRLMSNDAVEVTSGARVAIHAPELEVRTLKASFFASSLAYVGKVLDGEIDRVALVARTVDRTIERVTERLKRSFRTIEEIERVKAQELDVDVSGGVSLHADSTVVSAEKLVKIDGEQIHLG